MTLTERIEALRADAAFMDRLARMVRENARALDLLRSSR